MSNELKIRTLTERFLEGETTLEEEQWLYDRYRKGDVPADLLRLRPLFLGLDDIAPKRETTVVKQIRWSRWIAIAASVLILLIGGITYYNSLHQDEYVAYIYGKKCTDRQVVMQEVERGISEITDDGTANIEQELNELFDIN